MILRSPTEDENGGISLHRIWTPFPLMGKGRDRGAPEPIKPITPTFVLPRRGEGIRALPQVGFFISQSLAQPQTQFSKEDTEFTEIGIFLDQELFTLRPPRLGGEISELLT